MGEGHNANKKCGLTELLIFIAAIVSGTACSICSKTMMELKGEGITGEVEIFRKPIFQTFGMFVGMLFGLVMHGVVMYFEIPFPGYTFNSSEKNGNSKESSTTKNPASNPTETDRLLVKTGDNNNEEQNPSMQSLPVWMYFFLAIPSIFDLGATALCMMGLQYIDVSIYQLLRGSGIIFVALMKQHVLDDKLFGFQWIGVVWNVASVVLVGGTAILNESQSASEENGAQGQALLGVCLVMAGAIVQAMQFVFEEKVMTMDIPSPPLLLIGMEGLWGTVLCLIFVYPFAFYLPGDDHGSYEDFFNTWHMITHSSVIQSSFVIYFFAIFLYNFFAVLVTFLLSSVWHAILDNFRPITVWGTDLFIFYVVTSSGDFGEQWTKYSWIQVGGMFVLLYGTAVYNAPNPGSIRLEGQWFACGLNYNDEYKLIEAEEEDKVMDAEWQDRMTTFKKRTGSSFFGDHSPYTSIHTQALRGLAAAKN